MTRYYCVHGHFYQPPRENPWLEALDPDPSAYPYPNWNERITAECYRPNIAARILDDAGFIDRIVNNYARMSFNMGPTLLAWMEQAAPDVYRAIVDADRDSAARFGGHGSAMAQVYNHMIMPLADARDRRTQVRWGVRDFERRFGRAPAGMWLSETAVDLDSLVELADAGIEFTVLAPHQARRVRRMGGPWQEVPGASIDPGRVYRAVLPGGRSIDLFFYDGPAARAVAFERLLASGVGFANRLLAGGGAEPRLHHIATDGESYGHHHRFGEMALAYAVRHIDDHRLATATNYAQFRELHPAEWEVEIAEDTSWSCAHGVERWRSDCGCNAGHAGWNQKWRGPLRDALDWLRDQAVALFERHGAALFPDPWAARDAYIDVVLDRTDATVDAFLAAHAPAAADRTARRRALELLEMQRNAMLMYTSCGWFFDDVSGIEAAQILSFAARCVDLADRHAEQ
ncbi:MAG TPA: DUF3536 domain-containing protein, partial [Kofleriaceae bacterium]|nr:DUF3536 domain-containing protein [Kofleriaceae bacterium]